MYEWSGRRYIASLRALPARFGRGWRIAVVVPVSAFMWQVERANREAVIIAVVALLLSVIPATVLARSISRPMAVLARDALRIRHLHLDTDVSIRSRIREVQTMSDAMAAMKAGLQSFRCYVPATLVRQLVETGEVAKPGGQLRELTILFTDIENFTGTSEDLSPEELLPHLSQYLDELTDIIQAEEGTVDKYLGDGIMAFWGAPVWHADHAARACRAALSCQDRLAELNETWRRQGRPVFRTRIGVHTGEVVVGNVGSTDRMNYSVIGDSVNLTSRLERANKVFGTLVIVSGATQQQAAEEFVFRPLGSVDVRGRREETPIYQLLACREDPDAEEGAALAEQFSAALTAFLDRRWERAAEGFEAILRRWPDDGPATAYLARARAYAQTPPDDPDWSPMPPVG